MAINLPIISEWNPAGVNKAINDFKKLETTGQRASFAIKKAAVPAGLALAALGAVAFAAVKAFAEDDAAAQKLGVTLKNVTGATDAQIKSVEKFITKTSIAAVIWARMASKGSRSAPSRAMVSRRRMASAALDAWQVEKQPS